MKFLKEKFSLILSILYIILMLGICIGIMINIINSSKYIYFIYFLLAIIIVFLINLFLFKKNKQINQKFFLISLVIAIILYSLLLFLPYNEPYVDYATFYNNAIHFATDGAYASKYMALFPHLWGYIMFLGVLFKIFGVNYLVVIISNVILNFISTYFVFKIIKSISDKKTAYFGTILWLYNPINLIWCMFAFGGTAFNTFLAISIYLTINFFKANHLKNKLLYSLLMGLFLGITNLFRPVSIIFIIAFLIVLIYEYFIKKPNNRILNVICTVIIFVFYICVGKISNIYLEHEIGYESATSVGFTLFSGSDINSDGSWSATGSKILNEGMEKEPFDANEIQNNLQSLAIENYLNNGIKNINLLLKKFVLLTSDVGGYSWNSATSMLDIDFQDNKENIISFVSVLGYYILILINLLFGIYAIKQKELPVISNILILFIGGFTIASIILEVSPRYFLPTLIPLTILGSVGVVKKQKN